MAPRMTVYFALLLLASAFDQASFMQQSVRVRSGASRKAAQELDDEEDDNIALMQGGSCESGSGMNGRAKGVTVRKREVVEEELDEVFSL